MEHQPSKNAINEMRDYICDNVDELMQKDAVELLQKLRDAGVKLREKNGGVQVMMKDASTTTTIAVYKFMKQILEKTW